MKGEHLMTTERRLSIDEVRAAEEANRKPGDGSRLCGVLLYILSGLITVGAVVITYSDAPLVRGDALNMMIAGVRGLVFMTVALMVAVAAASCRITAAILDQSRAS